MKWPEFECSSKNYKQEHITRVTNDCSYLLAILGCTKQLLANQVMVQLGREQAVILQFALTETSDHGGSHRRKWGLAQLV